MFLSICIPTFNRTHCLNNCLNSIYISNLFFNCEFEVCISDNCSTEDVEKVVNSFKDKIKIKFKKNKQNLGLGKNIVESVSMAEGDYVWIIGNDDLLLPNTLQKLFNLLSIHKDVDYFYINSFHLNSKHVFSFEQPFNTKNLPKKMEKFSKKEISEKLDFFKLIKPEISFDFLLGMFLSVFKRKKWVENINVINEKLISDSRLYSNFDNTCPHVKIFSYAFSNSKAYFQAEPLSVNLYGEREWGSLYPFVEIIRTPEVLDLYKKRGLSLFKYLYCKNFALRNFLPNLIKILFFKKIDGLKYISFRKHIFRNLLFPNIYLSIIYFIFRKIFKFKFIKIK